MSNQFKYGDCITLALSGDRYKILHAEEIFIKTINIDNGYTRIFRRRDLLNQITSIECCETLPSNKFLQANSSKS